MKKFFTILLLLANISLTAQVPSTMGFTANIRDSIGTVLADQVVTVKLTINDVLQTEGVFSYTEQRLFTTDSFGNIHFDFGENSEDIIREIDWSTGDKMLTVEVDPENDGGSFVLAQIVKLYSVPYALFAGSANNVPASSDGNKGIDGATGPQGAAGASGDPGSPGPPGPIGPLGEPGMASGITGPTGPTGPTAGPGTTNGPEGAVGPQGPEGPVAPPNGFDITGAMGPTGNMGNEGVGGVVGPVESPWQTQDGNIYLEQLFDKTVLLKSPDGACWELAISGSGNLISIPLECP